MHWTQSSVFQIFGLVKEPYWVGMGSVATINFSVALVQLQCRYNVVQLKCTYSYTVVYYRWAVQLNCRYSYTFVSQYWATAIQIFLPKYSAMSSAKKENYISNILEIQRGLLFQTRLARLIKINITRSQRNVSEIISCIQILYKFSKKG